MARRARFRVTISRLALHDADEIHAYIAQFSPLNADRFIGALRAHVRSLERFPRRCRVAASESRVAGFQVRACLFGTYRILFTISDRDVFVLRIVHAARRSGRVPT